MTYTLKKIQMAIMTLLLTMVGQVQSDCCSSIDEECGKSCSCAPAWCGKGFFSADLLYWRAFEDGLDDCFPVDDYDYISSSYGTILSRFKGKGEDPRFNWDAGFRLGTGYVFDSGWDIGVYWTHFHSHASKHYKQDSYAFRNENEVHWNLNFEVVDLIVAHEFNSDSCFTWRPFAGLRGARIKQKLRTNSFSNGDSFEESSSAVAFLSDYSSSNFATSSVHNKQRFLGIGPLIGLEADWSLGCNLSLYANASVAFLYGHFHVRSKESDQFVDGADFCQERRKLSACQTVLDAGVGIRWQTCLCGNRAWLQLGLEHHSYFNQNRFGTYGDLCLDGANFSVGIEF